MKPILIIIIMLLCTEVTLSNAIEADPGYTYVNIFNIKEKYNTAVDMVRTKLNTDEKYFIIGMLYLPQEPTKAKEAFLEQIRVRDNHILSYLMLAYLCLKTDTQDAIKFGRKALSLDPKRAEIYNLIAVADSLIGDQKEAINILETGLTVIGDEESLLYNQSLMLYQYFLGSDTDIKIVRNMTKAISNQPREEFFVIFGSYYLKKNGNEEAIKVFKSGLERHPQNIFMTLGLSTAYKNKGEYETALNIANTLLHKYPDNNIIIQEIKEYQDEYNNWKLKSK